MHIRFSFKQPAGLFARKWTTKKFKKYEKILPQNTFISIHTCKQVFKVTESEFFHKSIKNCKNGKIMKFKYAKNVVPYVTQANSGITLEVFHLFFFIIFFLLPQIQAIK